MSATYTSVSFSSTYFLLVSITQLPIECEKSNIIKNSYATEYYQNQALCASSIEAKEVAASEVFELWPDHLPIKCVKLAYQDLKFF